MAIKEPKYIGLFPQTAPIYLTPLFIKVLNYFLTHKEGVLQKKVVQKLKVNKTTVSQIKADLRRIGWVTETFLGSGKEILIKPCKVNEINLFLSQLKYLKHSVLVRPHSIHIRGFIINKSILFEKALNNLNTQKEFRVLISDMHNNKKYTVETEYGKAVFHKEGKLVTFWINGFIMPVMPEDIPLFEDYIEVGICDRFFKLHSLLNEHFQEFNMKLSNVFYLKSLHLGILTKENVAKALALSKEDFYVDNSVYGLKETESQGKLDKVTENIRYALEEYFEKSKSAKL